MKRETRIKLAMALYVIGVLGRAALFVLVAIDLYVELTRHAPAGSQSEIGTVSAS
jgi:hypothetical protein